MHRIIPLVRRILPCAILLGIAAPLVHADQAAAISEKQLTVTLHDGRQFRGQIGETSNSDQLVLRFVGDGITVWRPIAWNHIARAEVADRHITGAQLHKIVVEILTARNDNPFDADDQSPSALPEPTEFVSPVPGFYPIASGVPPAPRRPPPLSVRSLRIEAAVANWDADVEVDGLVLEILPLDQWGDIVPINGTVTAELIGNRPAALRTRYVYHRGHPFPRLGRWTHRLQADRPESYRVQLPFRAAHPEFDFDLAAWAVVHARLVVPGQGVFETTADLVRIRPFSPIRDWRQQVMISGGRFFPEERLGRSN